ncbi:hypothetical protein [Vibrio phage VP882]|uniref:Uncharacterized protein n=1 Tax=Vibrio phage VP882 TaxID=2913982 RepID=A2I2W8_9CAUD|nr:hypothetical protein VPVV882_gp08 [Vibrio phage VP882]ABM73382.1 hypothetical protein [Vibrio phage VP882]
MTANTVQDVLPELLGFGRAGEPHPGTQAAVIIEPDFLDDTNLLAQAMRIEQRGAVLEPPHPNRTR